MWWQIEEIKRAIRDCLKKCVKRKKQRPLTYDKNKANKSEKRYYESSI
jgi:hypothetical protein